MTDWPRSEPTQNPGRGLLGVTFLLGEVTGTRGKRACAAARRPSVASAAGQPRTTLHSNMMRLATALACAVSCTAESNGTPPQVRHRSSMPSPPRLLPPPLPLRSLAVLGLSSKCCQLPAYRTAVDSLGSAVCKARSVPTSPAMARLASTICSPSWPPTAALMRRQTSPATPKSVGPRARLRPPSRRRRRRRL